MPRSRDKGEQLPPEQREVRIVAYIFPDEAEALEEQARVERCSKSELIRRALRAYLHL
jgi:hypothetical protein